MRPTCRILKTVSIWILNFYSTQLFKYHYLLLQKYFLESPFTSHNGSITNQSLPSYLSNPIYFLLFKLVFTIADGSIHTRFTICSFSDHQNKYEFMELYGFILYTFVSWQTTTFLSSTSWKFLLHSNPIAIPRKPVFLY